MTATDYDQGWTCGYRGQPAPDDASPEFTSGYFAGYGDLLADEKREATRD